MSRPSRLVRVEWTACRHPARPNDRSEQSRNFSSREAAGDQVLEIRRYEPDFMELLGVWECDGGDGRLDWRPIDPDSLPHSDRAEARDRQFRQHSTPYLSMMRKDPNP